LIRPGSALSKTLAVAALGAMAALSWLGLIAPLGSWCASIMERRDAARTERAKLLESIARLETEAMQLSADSTSGVVWTAPRMGEANAMVQSRISELAQRNGIPLRSITPTEASDLPLAESVAFRAESDATLDQVANFLISLEYHSPALAVERATLRHIAKPGPQTEQPLLFVQLDIIAPVVTLEEASE
jgi:Type II secretion system (T2SS), protein M subtype b